VVFLDFYGTLVHEDDVFIAEICKCILSTSAIQTTTVDIGKYWWKSCSNDFYLSHGDNFRTQREIELRSLEDTISFFKSSADPIELSEILYDYWKSPTIFEDTRNFLENADITKVILSNIDRIDIQAAINKYELPLEHIYTSEDVRSYQPRPEMFQTALAEHNLNPDEVLHIGDSLSSDCRCSKCRNQSSLDKPKK
jgi:FMN phosphatase YigB (HAD superfamily)